MLGVYTNCERRTAYETRTEASAAMTYKGDVVYHCPKCSKWHVKSISEKQDAVCYKVPYVTERAAKSALHSAKAAQGKGNDRRHETRTYQCNLCSFWHLTSGELR